MPYLSALEMSHDKAIQIYGYSTDFTNRFLMEGCFSPYPGSRVERSAAARNIRILSVYFSQTSEDSSLLALLPLTVCVVPEQ